MAHRVAPLDALLSRLLVCPLSPESRSGSFDPKPSFGLLAFEQVLQIRYPISTIDNHFHSPNIEQIAFGMMALLPLDENPAVGNGGFSSALSIN
jgi:hypothetical protein